MDYKSLTKTITPAPATSAPDTSAGDKAEEPGKLYAPVTGTSVALSSIDDEVFASGALGEGIAIIPDDGEVYAPCSGVISNFFAAGHAVGITSTDGVELMIHVGMDTLALNGEGFTPMVKTGDTVRKGQLLMKFDIEQFNKKGYKTITPMTVINREGISSLTPAPYGKVSAKKDVVLNYQK